MAFISFTCALRSLCDLAQNYRGYTTAACGTTGFGGALQPDARMDVQRRRRNGTCSAVVSLCTPAVLVPSGSHAPRAQAWRGAVRPCGDQSVGSRCAGCWWPAHTSASPMVMQAAASTYTTSISAMLWLATYAGFTKPRATCRQHVNSL